MPLTEKKRFLPSSDISVNPFTAHLLGTMATGKEEGVRQGEVQRIGLLQSSSSSRTASLVWETQGVSDWNRALCSLNTTQPCGSCTLPPLSLSISLFVSLLSFFLSLSISGIDSCLPFHLASQEILWKM